MIKAENNWIKFFSRFSQNNAPFIHIITKKHPDLTGSQFKVCTYLRAGYNTEGISEMMDLSVRSVESHRFRLRQKLKLSSSENLVTHLMNYSWPIFFKIEFFKNLWWFYWPISKRGIWLADQENSVRRLAAIMFTDMVNYSKLMQQDEAGTLKLLEDQQGIPVSAGVYIYRLQAKGFQKTRKMVLLK